MGMAEEIHEALESLRAEGDGLWRGECALPATFSGFQGHFPGQPVMPAVCQIEMVRCLVEAAEGGPLQLDRIVRAKYVLPIAAEERVVVEVRSQGVAEGLRSKASLSVGREMRSSIDLVLSRAR
jgi:3-hydroxyacyl-[acyl-carrier-protein] dehydratase